MVTATAARFANAGYRVEIVAVGTPASISRLGAEQRFLGARNPLSARWTPPEAHETALTGSPVVLAALEASPAVARVQVHSRNRLLYENARGVDGAWMHEAAAAEVLRAEQERRLDAAEAAAWLERYQAVFDTARARPGYLSPLTAPAYRLLADDAETLMPIAASDPTTDAAALRRAQDRRRIALRTIVPEPKPGVFRRIGEAMRREPPPTAPKERPRQPPTRGL